MSSILDRYRHLTGNSGAQNLSPRIPVPRQEIAIIIALLINVAWLFYAMGGVRVWGIATSAAITIATLILLPEWTSSDKPFRKKPVGRLLCSPLFWLGFLLYSYITIQSINLDWVWTTAPNGRPKLVFNRDYISWLPTGISSPLDEANPFRSMLFYITPWLCASIFWAGVQSRRVATAFLYSLNIIGVVFAAVALYQHFTDATKILGIFSSSRTSNDEILFWGTLGNANHAAFFLLLANGLSLGLFLQGWDRYLRHFQRHGGAWLLNLGFSIIVTFAILMAQARGPMVILAIQWIGFLIICSSFFMRRFGLKGIFLPLGLFTIVAVVATTFVVNPTVFERQELEWEKTIALKDNPEAEARYYMTLICSDMIADKPLFGHGSGSFRYVHFPYKAHYPDFKTENTYKKKNPKTKKWESYNRILWFQNAHVDLLEYIVEWGFIGSAFPALAILYLCGVTLASFRGWDHGLMTVLMSVFLVFAGAAIEFHFRIPLVLLTWVLTFVCTVKLFNLRHRLMTSS